MRALWCSVAGHHVPLQLTVFWRRALRGDLSPPFPRQIVRRVRNIGADIDVLHGAWFAAAEGEAAARAFTVKPAVAWLTTTPDAGSERVAWAGTGADLTRNPAGAPAFDFTPRCIIFAPFSGRVPRQRVR
jgi:hypothetical protein